MHRIILASESPRRREILDRMGISHEVIPSDIEEIVQETEPDKIVRSLAGKKAGGVARRLTAERDLILIAADTMVFSGREALGKPANEEDARRMMQLLSGAVHEVITGVHILIRSEEKEKELSFSVSTKVSVHPLTKEQIDSYVMSGEGTDKAGGYGIQGSFGVFIASIEGDYYNVVGLPIAEIYRRLLEEGIDLKK